LEEPTPLVIISSAPFVEREIVETNQLGDLAIQLVENSFTNLLSTLGLNSFDFQVQHVHGRLEAKG
jgi:hypothetical protein